MTAPISASDARSRHAALIERLQGEAARRPEAYQRRVVLLGLLGHAVLLAVLSGIAGLAFLVGALLVGAGSGGAAALGIKLLLPLLVLGFVILRALWIRLPPPEGIVLERADYPELHAALDRIRKALRGPPLHRVLLTDDFNAAAVQHPRFGWFGGARNHLVIGLRLCQALTPDQLLAVLAHEYGHLAGAHGKLAGWVYRVRQTWMRLAVGIHARALWGAGLLRRFFDWYAPYFDAYSFVLARSNEYAADRAAAEIVGRGTAGAALVAAAVKGLAIERTIWPSFVAQADQAPEPAAGPNQALATALRAPTDPELLAEAMRRKTGLDDTHPCLADRLAALGVAPAAPLPLARSAAEAWLGEHLAALIFRFDQHWRTEAEPQWRARFEAAQAARRSLAELQAKAASRPLDTEELWSRAKLTERLQGRAAAQPHYEEVLAAKPDHGWALLALGQLRLDSDDVTGLDMIEAAMTAEPATIFEACAAAGLFLEADGRPGEAAHYRERAAARADLLYLADMERSQLSRQETFLPHGLPAETVDAVRQLLARWPVLRRAYLARKQVTHLPEEPAYLLALEIARLRWRRTDQAMVAEIAQSLRTPGVCLVVPLVRRNRWMRKRLRDLPDALVLGRPGRRFV